MYTVALWIGGGTGRGEAFGMQLVLKTVGLISASKYNGIREGNSGVFFYLNMILIEEVIWIEIQMVRLNGFAGAQMYIDRREL